MSYEAFDRVRRATVELAAPLSPEDMGLQSMADASPTKWHLAHTTWFFEELVLAPLGEPRHHPGYAFLFNSYYEAVGARHARDKRGMLSRPSAADVLDYRASVDARVRRAFERGLSDDLAKRVEIGLHHEMQHQELLLTDIKHALFQSPLLPAYTNRPRKPLAPLAPIRFREHPVSGGGGLFEIGATGGFAFDNERPRHKVWVEPFAIADRLVTVGEYREFIADRGYERPELWLSEGHRFVRDRGLRAPLYWLDSGERAFTLRGATALESDEPVCHVSHFEADAYARWAGARLPTEIEWELACTSGEGNLLASSPSATGPVGFANFLETGALHPTGGAHLMGDAWQWTASPYVGYPGFRPLEGALGEYNGKFMSAQMVLRGGSCFSARAHVRPTYRNFFPSEARWQMTGIRLARA